MQQEMKQRRSFKEILKTPLKPWQILVFLVLPLCIAGFWLLWMRTCPTWEPASVTVQTAQLVPQSPQINPDGMTQETRLLPSEGYARIPAAEDSFLAFMRNMPVYPDGSLIYLYNGETTSNSYASAVYDMDVGNADLQQCADSIIRVYTEYFWKTNQTERIAFHTTSGFLFDYHSWRDGKRALVLFDWVQWVPIQGKDTSYQQLLNYLKTVMRYAGTLSLEKESQTILLSEAKTGDFFCCGGSPGHVILIVDEAVNAEGERCFLLAQGMMPAQSFHILAGPYEHPDDPWYTEEDLSKANLNLGGFSFTAEHLRRWGEGFANE